MPDGTAKPSQVDAVPDAGPDGPEPSAPGTSPRHAETDARPDEGMRNDIRTDRA